MVSPQCERAYAFMRVRKSRKLAFHHYALKSESDDYVKKYNQIQANQIAWTQIPCLLTQLLISGVEFCRPIGPQPYDLNLL